MIDTIKLRSPTIDEGTASFLESQSILKSGVDLATGEVLYEFTTGNLEGSWDSRISLRVMREDWVSNGKSVELIPCEPYVVVEASLHKFFYGHNVYGGPCNFRESCRVFVNFLGEILGSNHEMFFEADHWQVRRVDWAEVFRLSPGAQNEFFRALKAASYPRRAMKEAKYATAVHFPGAFTTFRIYAKGPEFKEHTAGLLRTALLKYIRRQEGEVIPMNLRALASKKQLDTSQKYSYINRKIDALQRLANNRLRAEVQINADKLRHDFGGVFPKVSEMTEEYMIKVYEKEMFKLLREGKSAMETVRTHDAVVARLNSTFSKRTANSLFTFWLQLATRGEEAVKAQYSRTSFFENRAKLIKSGISWLSSDVFIVPQDTALPRDFQPLRADIRRCTLPVSNHSIFNLCPVEYAQLKRAA